MATKGRTRTAGHSFSQQIQQFSWGNCKLIAPNRTNFHRLVPTVPTQFTTQSPLTKVLPTVLSLARFQTVRTSKIKWLKPDLPDGLGLHSQKRKLRVVDFVLGLAHSPSVCQGN